MALVACSRCRQPFYASCHDGTCTDAACPHCEYGDDDAREAAGAGTQAHPSARRAVSGTSGTHPGGRPYVRPPPGPAATWGRVAGPATCHASQTQSHRARCPAIGIPGMHRRTAACSCEGSVGRQNMVHGDYVQLGHYAGRYPGHGSAL